MTKRKSHSGPIGRREALGLLGVGAGFGLVTAFGERASLFAAPWQAAGRGPQNVTFPRGAIIRTILKDISPDVLAGGPTLFHDHLELVSPYPFVKPCGTMLPEGELKPPNPGGSSACRASGTIAPNWLEDVDAVVEEVKLAAEKDGVKCVLTGGTRDLGQSPVNMKQIAERLAPVGVHVVMADAYHTFTRYPPQVATQTEDQIADEFTRDSIAQRWGAIGELGSSDPMHPLERKVFLAMAKVHQRTGLPIFTHTSHQGCKKCALEQVDLLEKAGVNFHNLCIGHLSDIADDPTAETHKAIAKRGAFVGFDTVGHVSGPMARADAQVKMVMAFLQAGYEDYAIFGNDATSPAERRKNGGAGFDMELTVFIPKLRAAGVSDATIHKMTVDNPRRFLAFVPKRA